jgi:2,3-bisphosphoglycerate-dependent phosphoglycerate mutase
MMSAPSPSSPAAAGKAVLLRHAQSQWNLENRFSGWQDMDLSEAGVEEARRAAHLIKAAGLRFDRAFVSALKRAARTLEIVLQELGQNDVVVERSWRLNERHYGALEGLNKQEIAARYGSEQFRAWRRSYATRPPALSPEDPRHPRHDPRYADVDPALLPAAESLADTLQRVVPYWEQAILPHLIEGETVLVVSHGNTLRALVKYLDQLSDEAVEKLEIPTGVPLVYEFDAGGRPRRHYYLAQGSAASASAA